jgi:hydrogenase maturation factor
VNLVYAEVVAVSTERGARMGKVRVRGALSQVPLDLVPEAQPGDTVLVCDGVAIGKVGEHSDQSSIIGGNNVSGCSR